MLGLPEKVEEFDYGLKMETEAATDSKNLTAPMDVVRKRYENWFHVKSVKISYFSTLFRSNLTDDAYLMVTQTNWEDEVIWNGEEIKHKGKALCSRNFQNVKLRLDFDVWSFYRH